VTIGQIGSRPDEVTFQFRVFDNTSRLIEESTVSAEHAPFDPYVGTPAEALHRFAELHSLARRYALGVDKALSDLLVSLEQIR
jgi:hypothetical protein